MNYLTSVRGNVTATARMFGIQRLTVYNILDKKTTGDLNDRSKAPKKVANKTPRQFEKKILLIKRKTTYGAKRLRKHLFKYYHLNLPLGTIRGILRRNEV